MAAIHLPRARPASRWIGDVHLQTMLVALLGLFFGAVLALNVATLLAPPRLAFALDKPARGPARVAWVLPASFTYAILRHQILNVPLLQRWLVHSLLWVALLALYVTATYGVHKLLFMAVPEPGHSITLAAVLALLIGLTFRPLYQWLKHPLDRFIFKDTYDYRATLQALSHDLSLVGNLDALGAALPGTLRRLMNLDFAVLLIHARRDDPYAYDADDAYQPALLPALVDAARRAGDAACRYARRMRSPASFAWDRNSRVSLSAPRIAP